MKSFKKSHDDEAYDLDNVYNEEEERYMVADTSQWYS